MQRVLKVAMKRITNGKYDPTKPPGWYTKSEAWANLQADLVLHDIYRTATEWQDYIDSYVVFHQVRFHPSWTRCSMTHDIHTDVVSRLECALWVHLGTASRARRNMACKAQLWAHDGDE